jgi:beta-lactamase superfamily II metal-dependent hydrolase
VAYLKSKPIDDIDVMIASHADSDHIGDLIDMLESDIPIEAVYYNGYPGDRTIWSNFATAVANKGLTLTAAQFPQEYTWGSVTAQVQGWVLRDEANHTFIFHSSVMTPDQVCRVYTKECLKLFSQLIKAP